MSGYARGLLTAGNNNVIEKRLWDAADDLRANSGLKSYEYSLPVLGLIFLKHSDYLHQGGKGDRGPRYWEAYTRQA